MDTVTDSIDTVDRREGEEGGRGREREGGVSKFKFCTHDKAIHTLVCWF